MIKSRIIIVVEVLLILVEVKKEVGRKFEYEVWIVVRNLFIECLENYR